MLLSYDQLIHLIRTNVIENGVYAAVNSASVDVHLGETILTERDNDHIVDYRKREKLAMTHVLMDPEEGYVLRPGEFVLAHTVEVFNLPRHISGEYKLKSSMARIGLEHLNAGWADAGWNGSSLTLELKNITSNHAIRIRPGDAIGQMVFFSHDPVPFDKSYAYRGRYNKDGQTVVAIKE